MVGGEIMECVKIDHKKRVHISEKQFNNLVEGVTPFYDSSLNPNDGVWTQKQYEVSGGIATSNIHDCTNRFFYFQ